MWSRPGAAILIGEAVHRMSRAAYPAADGTGRVKTVTCPTTPLPPVGAGLSVLVSAA